MIRTVAAMVLSVLPISAAAQDCDGTTQLELNSCAKSQWEITDHELNRLWGKVKPLADARGNGGQLLQEQRAWLQHRDATCEPDLESGGSAAPMVYWFCMEEMTAARNNELRALMR